MRLIYVSAKDLSEELRDKGVLACPFRNEIRGMLARMFDARAVSPMHIVGVAATVARLSREAVRQAGVDGVVVAMPPWMTFEVENFLLMEGVDVCYPYKMIKRVRVGSTWRVRSTFVGFVRKPAYGEDSVHEIVEFA